MRINFRYGRILVESSDALGINQLDHGAGVAFYIRSLRCVADMAIARPSEDVH